MCARSRSLANGGGGGGRRSGGGGSGSIGSGGRTVARSCDT